MREALLLSIKIHGLWFYEAMDVRGRYLAPLRPRRLVMLLIGYPLFLMVQVLHWLGFLLDELLFREYREVIIKEPLIITGIPRSGTTFIHRTLARADHQFTTFQMWEALLAPSITERHVIRWIARMDNKLSARPLHKLLDKITASLTEDFAHIHAVGLKSPEEDYLALLPVGACFIMVLAFPASQSLWQLGRFQEMPDDERHIIMEFYKACLKKHLYWVGPEKRLLSKNAAFGSWLPDLRFAFPDARYLFCIRQPGPALASQLSSIRSGLEFFGTMPGADTYSLELQTIFAHIYRILLKEKQSFLMDHLAVIDQSELKQDSAGVLRSALKQLCVTVDARMEQILEQAGEESRRHSSQHKHKPLTDKHGPDEFNSLVESIYQEILEHPYMTRDEE